MKSISRKKILSHVKDFIRTKRLQEEIKKLRSDYGIPVDGFAVPVDEELTKAESPLYQPENVEVFGGTERYWEMIRRYVEFLKENLEVFNPSVRIALVNYLLYNHLNEGSVLSTEWGRNGMCMILYLKHHEEEVPEEHLLGIIRGITKYYPLGVMIHPQATQRDVIAYVKENWKSLHAEMLGYRRNQALGKLRRKPQQERNDLVYSNRHLPKMQLRKLLREKGFGILDDGHLSKIISLEEKKRN